MAPNVFARNAGSVTETTLELPWPPTANTYYRHSNAGSKISKKGRAYKRAVQYSILGMKSFGDARLEIQVRAFPPDRRARDLDNLWKALLDSMEGMLFDDDSQFDKQSIERCEVEKLGKVEVWIRRL